MEMMNDNTQSDETLASRAVGGDRNALEALVRRYAPWVYNMAWRMVGDPIEAEDIAQESLIKVVTRLSSFRRESRFRTWLYSIVARHALDLKRRPLEMVFSSFNAHGKILDGLSELPDHCPSSAERRLMIDETRSTCLEGMLLCLDREQRAIFILGGLFGVSSKELGEVLDLTAEAARQRLSRARHELQSFMYGRCGLFDPPGPCRCSHKTAAAVRAGYLDPGRRVFSTERIRRVREQVDRAGPGIDNLLNGEGLGAFLEEPFLDCRPSLIANLIDTLSKGSTL
jgi:RNA polymerase sigma factor (sigma-70 family)